MTTRVKDMNSGRKMAGRQFGKRKKQSVRGDVVSQELNAL